MKMLKRDKCVTRNDERVIFSVKSLEAWLGWRRSKHYFSLVLANYAHSEIRATMPLTNTRITRILDQKRARYEYKNMNMRMNRDKNLKCYSSAHYEMYRTVAWKITSIIFIYKFYKRSRSPWCYCFIFFILFIISSDVINVLNILNATLPVSCFLFQH